MKGEVKRGCAELGRVVGRVLVKIGYRDEEENLFRVPQTKAELNIFNSSYRYFPLLTIIKNSAILCVSAFENIGLK